LNNHSKGAHKFGTIRTKRSTHFWPWSTRHLASPTQLKQTHVI